MFVVCGGLLVVFGGLLVVCGCLLVVCGCLLVVCGGLLEVCGRLWWLVVFPCFSNYDSEKDIQDIQDIRKNTQYQEIGALFTPPNTFLQKLDL